MPAETVDAVVRSIVLDADRQTVWDAISRVVGAERSLSSLLERKNLGYSRDRYREDVEFVISWLDAGCREPLRHVRRQALISAAIECLSKYALRGKAPLAHITLLQQLDSVPTAVDRAYPGYQAARLLPQVVQMETAVAA